MFLELSHKVRCSVVNLLCTISIYVVNFSAVYGAFCNLHGFHFWKPNLLRSFPFRRRGLLLFEEELAKPDAEIDVVCIPSIFSIVTSTICPLPSRSCYAIVHSLNVAVQVTISSLLVHIWQCMLALHAQTAWLVPFQSSHTHFMRPHLCRNARRAGACT